MQDPDAPIPEQGPRDSDSGNTADASAEASAEANADVNADVNAGVNAELGRFAQQWSRCSDQVRLFVCSAVWNRTDAEDVVQEVAYKAGRGFSGYDPARPFSAWVMAIARNEVKMHLRTRARDRHTFDDGLLDLLADTTARSHDELSPRAAALRECMAKLPEPAKALLRMRYVDSTQAPTLADRLGLTVNAVHQRLKRIREALADCIERRLSREGARG